jgi:glycosyltransferase involved in cell wall biosynthesis
VDVTYVQQLYIPRVGLAVSVPLYAASLVPHRERLQWADLVLATWAYPDGCAAALAAHALGKPCVVKVHGSDVNVVLRRRVPRAIARRILPRCEATVAVSHPLARELIRLGVPTGRVHRVDNGVNVSLFFPRDRREARRALGVPEDARVILFVGRLEPQKGVHELLEAFEGVRALVPRAVLVLLGDGVSRREVTRRAVPWGDQARVLGPAPHACVADWMAACDVLALPSWTEGTPNVVLEALASGRPAVASSVGGIPDVLADPRAGLLVPPRDARALRDALASALAAKWDEQAVRACGPRSWDESARALYGILRAVTANRVPDRSAARAPARPSAL